jgi:RNA 3'-terminal phosphate cyclase
MQEESQEEKSMDTTVTIEFTSNMEQHLRILEQQLKHIRDVKVDLVEARDHKAPSLFAIAIGKSGERAEKAAETVAQVLHDFLHTETAALSHKTIYLVTIEGERIDIEPMSVEDITGIIMAAKAGEY